MAESTISVPIDCFIIHLSYTCDTGLFVLLPVTGACQILVIILSQILSVVYVIHGRE